MSNANSQYVAEFQKRMKIEEYQRKHAFALPFYDDPRLRERNHVKKIEPQSQILQQSILSHQNIQSQSSIMNYQKPLINTSLNDSYLNMKMQVPKRYNHNYSNVGMDSNIYQQQSTNQYQSDYMRDRQQSQSYLSNVYQNQNQQTYNPQNGSIIQQSSHSQHPRPQEQIVSSNESNNQYQSLQIQSQPQYQQQPPIQQLSSNSSKNRISMSQVGSMLFDKNEHYQQAGKPSVYGNYAPGVGEKSQQQIPAAQFGRNLKNLDAVQIF